MEIDLFIGCVGAFGILLNRPAAHYFGKISLTAISGKIRPPFDYYYTKYVTRPAMWDFLSVGLMGLVALTVYFIETLQPTACAVLMYIFVTSALFVSRPKVAQ